MFAYYFLQKYFFLTLQTSSLVTEVQIKHLFLIVDYIENEGLET